MKNLKLVIRGAYYYNREADIILIPHYTGEFSIVDCDIFETMDEIKTNYNEEYISQVEDNPIEFEGKKYYSSEYFPVAIDDDWELLSNLSELYHSEMEFDF